MDTRSKPTLPGERVLLRPLGPEHVDALFAAVQEPTGNRLTGTHARFTREQIAAWCERVAGSEGRIDCAILARAGGGFVGEAALNDIDADNLSANFRIALAAPEHYGRGYGSEATRLLLRYGFGTLGLHRIELEVYDFNPRALHVYEKVGFRREGVRRDALRWEGRWHDAILMGLLRHEFEPRG